VGTASRWRVGYSHDSGTATRFAPRLEHSLEHKWVPVVRYDHDGVTDHGGHDVTEEGLHMDVYRDDGKFRHEFIAPPMPAGVALNFAEDHLGENMQRFIKS
jgi:hypothetical protein